MALGGGIWATQNKVLPGTYINFSSAAKASANLSERGIAAAPLFLDWGPDDTVFTVTSGEFQKDSLKIFGHDYRDDALLPLRELFCKAKTVHAYRLNGGGAKAENTFCAARYSGIAGNLLSTVIEVNADDETLFDVSTYYGTTRIDQQTAADVQGLSDNDFVTWKKDATLTATARTPLTGGTNGEAVAAAFQSFLGKIESYSFHTLCCPSDDEVTIKLFVNFTKRMRDEIGAKFQTVIFNPGDGNVADHEGIIEVGNPVMGPEAETAGIGAYSLVYWMTGASAACEVNKSNTNKLYDGELTIRVDDTQTQLEQAIQKGRLMLHNVNGEIRILEDINSLVTVSDTKGEVYQSNQTIRVCDQIANDVAVLFRTRYLGVVPNDAPGRMALWNDICKLHQELEAIRAIEDFDPETVTVAQGDTKRSVVCNVNELNVINAMSQLYMSIVVK